jgi:hypothetical protein
MFLDTAIQLPDDWTSNPFPTGPADIELEWFFTMAECDMGARSNYPETVGQPARDSPETRAQAARAHRTIRDWLAEIGDGHAGVLYAAYAARPWLLPLREAFGRLTGVVVRLRSADDVLPDDESGRNSLDLRAAERLTVAIARKERDVLRPLELRASSLLRRAFSAYEQVRGGRGRPVLRGVSP